MGPTAHHKIVVSYDVNTCVGHRLHQTATFLRIEALVCKNHFCQQKTTDTMKTMSCLDIASISDLHGHCFLFEWRTSENFHFHRFSGSKVAKPGFTNLIEFLATLRAPWALALTCFCVALSMKRIFTMTVATCPLHIPHVRKS